MSETQPGHYLVSIPQLTRVCTVKFKAAPIPADLAASGREYLKGYLTHPTSGARLTLWLSSAGIRCPELPDIRADGGPFASQFAAFRHYYNQYYTPYRPTRYA